MKRAQSSVNQCEEMKTLHCAFKQVSLCPLLVKQTDSSAHKLTSLAESVLQYLIGSNAQYNVCLIADFADKFTS